MFLSVGFGKNIPARYVTIISCLGAGITVLFSESELAGTLTSKI